MASMASEKPLPPHQLLVQFFRVYMSSQTHCQVGVSNAYSQLPPLAARAVVSSYNICSLHSLATFWHYLSFIRLPSLLVCMSMFVRARSRVDGGDADRSAGRPRKPSLQFFGSNVASRVQAGDGVSVSMQHKQATTGRKCQMEKRHCVALLF